MQARNVGYTPYAVWPQWTSGRNRPALRPAISAIPARSSGHRTTVGTAAQKLLFQAIEKAEEMKANAEGITGGPVSPRSANRTAAGEWAVDGERQETLCGSLWDTVHTAETLDEEVRRFSLMTDCTPNTPSQVRFKSGVRSSGSSASWPARRSAKPTPGRVSTTGCGTR